MGRINGYQSILSSGCIQFFEVNALCRTNLRDVVSLYNSFCNMYVNRNLITEYFHK